MEKEKKEIGIEKLIELLNEYEVEKKPSRLQRNYYLGFVHNFGMGIMYIDEEGEDVDDYKTDYEIINKEYGFIKWLVENDKIDTTEIDKKIRIYDYVEEYEEYDYVFPDSYKQLLMLLSISDTPIEDLILYLK